MKLTKIVSAATSLILIGSTNVAPTTQTETYESQTSAPSLATISVVEEAKPEPELELGPAICQYYVEPGDIKMYGDAAIEYSNFQLVEETADGKEIRLSGWTIENKEWTYIMDTHGHHIASEGVLPFDIYENEVLAPPLAGVMGTFTLEGFTINEAGRTTYYPAADCYFLEGEEWKAAILDYTRYSEVKYGNNTPENYDLKYLCHAGNYWVVATEGAPIFPTPAEEFATTTTEPPTETTATTTTTTAPEENFYEKVSQAHWLRGGVTDPKYGAIEWGPAVEELNEDATSVYRINGKLNGVDFTLEIDNVDSNGFTLEHDWHGAIVPSNMVNPKNPCVLHIKGYTLSVFPDGSKTYVYDESRDEGHSVPCHMANDEVVLVTITDGKHAVAATFDVALLGYIWTLAQSE